MHCKRLFMFVGILTLLVACRPATATPTPTPEPLSGRLTFAGSTTVQPLADQLGRLFQQEHPAVLLDIAAGGSTVGIKAVHDGTVDIGMSSRALKPEEAEGIEQHQIATDVIAVVVNQANPVEGLTFEQLRDIYLGKITNWSQVGGPDQTITVVVRDVNSGTRGAFDEIVLNKQEPTSDHLIRAITAGDMAAVVARTPGGIGYVGFGNLESNLKVLAIDGVMPSEQTVRNGTYRLTRPLLLLTGPLTQPVAYAFIEMALSEAGQKVVAESGWVPVR